MEGFALPRVHHPGTAESFRPADDAAAQRLHVSRAEAPCTLKERERHPAKIPDTGWAEGADCEGVGAARGRSLRHLWRSAEPRPDAADGLWNFVGDRG